MKKLLLLTILLNSYFLIAQSPCSSGTSAGYPCDTLELHDYISASGMGALEGQDSWGWVDPLDGTEYAIVALDDGTAFVRLDSSSSPTTLEYIVKMDSHTGSSYWRDVKVYGNYAYVVSDSNGNHGMQIFDLTRLRTEFAPAATLAADARYAGISNAHNIIIDEDNGFLYILGSNRNSGGPRIMDLTNPLVPTVAGNISAYGYCHDAQAITYNGPDTEHQGKQLLIGSFSGSDYVRILDVTNKNSVTEIGNVTYSNKYYTHQGWFTHDQRFFIVGDEVDEENIGGNTRTFVFDMADLDNPVLHYTYYGSTNAIDHNGYVKGNKLYLANYAAGARVIDISGLYDATPSMTEIQYFDTYTPNNSANFHGVWNVYPFFDSGNLVVTGFGRLSTNGDGGLFIVKDPNYDAIDPVAVCQNISVTLDNAGSATITPAQIDNGSSDNVLVYDMWLDRTTFSCKDLGQNTVTLTIIDGNENKSTCTATVTVNPSLNPTSTTTYNGSWSNGVPDDTKKAIFTSSYNTSSGNIDACSCEIAPSVTLTVADGDYMNVKGSITVDGTLIVGRNGSVVQQSNNATVTNNGTINVNLRTPALNPRDFVILGNPMTLSDESVFTDGAPAYQVLNHTTANFTPYVGVPPVVGVNFHDQEGNDWSNFSGTLNPGEGYFVRPSITAGGTYNYNYDQGTLNNGEITYNAFFGDNKEDSPNVLANPYASAIDADLLISNNPIIDEVYFWEHNTTPGVGIPGPLSENFNMEDISTYNGTMGIAAASGGTAPTNLIGTGQGFGIKGNAAGNVTFNNAMRLTSNTTVRKTVEKDLIWIGVSENTYNMGSTAGIGFLKYASENYDRSYDTQKLGTVVSLYSHLPDGSLELGIQGREVFDSNIRIPMGFSTLIQADAGIPYVISIENLEGTNVENTTIYLLDSVTNITTNLSTDRYEFLSDAGTFNNRFTLHFEQVLSSDTDIIEDSLRVFPNPTSGIMTIQYPDGAIETATIFDVQGRMLFEEIFNERLDFVHNNSGNGVQNEYYTLDVSALNPAIYFIQFETSNGTITKQISKK